MNKLKIAFLIEDFPSISETFVLNQITGLIDLGHTVDIYAMERRGSSGTHPDVREYGLVERTEYYLPRSLMRRLAGAVRIVFSLAGQKPQSTLESLNIFRFGRNALNLKLLFALDAFLGKSYDIIQCHYGTNGNTGAFLKYSGQRGKLVTMFHGCDLRLGMERNGKIYRHLFRIGDCFQAISRYSAEILQDLGADPRKIVIHPVGIDIARFPYRQGDVKRGDKDAVVIVTIGRLVEEKGLEYGIRTIGRLIQLDSGKRFRYLIVGEGPLEERLKSLRDSLGLHRIVEFAGGMEQPDVVRTLQRADIFFLPSIAEILPVSLMEAQAIGLPIVATDVGGVSEVLAESYARLIVPAGDVDEMADRILLLIENPDIYRDLGVSGRRHVELNYDVHVLNQRLESLYQELIEGGRDAYRDSQGEQ